MATSHRATEQFQKFNEASQELATCIQDLFLFGSRQIPDAKEKIGKIDAAKGWELCSRIRGMFGLSTTIASEWEPLIASLGGASEVVEFHQTTDGQIRGTMVFPTAHSTAGIIIMGISLAEALMHMEPDGEQTEFEEQSVTAWLAKHWSVRESVQLQRIHARMIRERAQVASYLGVELIGAAGFASALPSDPTTITKDQLVDHLKCGGSSAIGKIAKEERWPQPFGSGNQTRWWNFAELRPHLVRRFKDRSIPERFVPGESWMPKKHPSKP